MMPFNRPHPNLLPKTAHMDCLPFSCSTVSGDTLKVQCPELALSVLSVLILLDRLPASDPIFSYLTLLIVR